MRNKSIILSIFFTLAILTTLYFDSEIVKGISLIRNNLFNDFFLGITFVSSGIIIFFFLTSLFLLQQNKRKLVLPLWLSLTLSVVVSFLLKIIIQRQRPFQLGFISVFHILEKASHLTWNLSFPSFQLDRVFP